MRRFVIPRLPLAALIAAVAAAAGATSPPEPNPNPDLFRNPGFAVGVDGWLFHALPPATATFEFADDGDDALRIDVRTTRSEWDVYVVAHRISVTAGEAYSFHVLVRSEPANQPVSLLVVDVNGETVYGRATSPAGSTWGDHTLRFVVPRDTEVDCFIATGGRTGRAWLSDASLRVVADGEEPPLTAPAIGPDLLVIAEPDTRTFLIIADLGSAGPVSLRVGAPNEPGVQLFRGEVAAGRFELSWNGCDAWGRPLDAGTYQVRLETPGAVIERPLELP